MIVDASAVLAVLFDETDGVLIGDKIAAAIGNLQMSPVNYLEASVRVDGLKSDEKSSQFDVFMKTTRIELAPVTPEQAALAREAYKTFGKGNHPAKLNLGDCFAYALSKARGEPLLFKGDDFRLTDVEAAI